MMTTAEAMKYWQSLRLYSNESCCTSSHEYYNREKNLLVPKPDGSVCDRELAWRQYVRIRDNDPNFPFNKQWLI